MYIFQIQFIFAELQYWEMFIHPVEEHKVQNYKKYSDMCLRGFVQIIKNVQYNAQISAPATNRASVDS